MIDIIDKTIHDLLKLVEAQFKHGSFLEANFQLYFMSQSVSQSF